MCKQLLCCFCTVYASLHVQAQNICTDSLPSSLLLNGSFENYDQCNPNWRGEGGLIDGGSSAVGVKIAYWHPENTTQSIRYYNYDCKRAIGSLFDKDFSILDTGFPGIPGSVPDGKGLISIEQNNISYTGDLPENKTDKKYITTCLPQPLQKDNTYIFSFDFGFGIFNSNYNDVTGFWASPSPFSVGIFGRTDCPAFPVDESYDNARGCLADRGGWILLGTAKMHGKSKWVKGFIEFTAPANISAIGVGPSCDYNGNIADTFALYYMDNFVLAQKKDFAYAQITALSGDACAGHYILNAPDADSATYQWMKDDDPIPGATQQQYNVPENDSADAVYTVRIQQQGKCYVSLPFDLLYAPARHIDLGPDKVICNNTPYQLHAYVPGILNYTWQDGSHDSTFTATKTATYSVHVTDNLGCTGNASTHITIGDCNSCRVIFPGAFTPNNDGKNDLFRPLPFCDGVSLLRYQLNIFNKWGQLVFHSSDAREGWNGMFNNKPAPQDAYVYVTEYSFLSGKVIRSQGSVTLIR